MFFTTIGSNVAMIGKFDIVDKNTEMLLASRCQVMVRKINNKLAPRCW